MKWRRTAWRALRTLLAMLAAFAVVEVINMGGSRLGDVLEVPGSEVRLAWDLAWVFIAGLLATFAVVLLAPAAPGAHALAFFVLALVVDVVAVVLLGQDWPRWFSAGLLLSLPLQVWLGWRLALRVRGVYRRRRLPTGA
jgi:hypothetical protein